MHVHIDEAGCDVRAFRFEDLLIAFGMETFADFDHDAVAQTYVKTRVQALRRIHEVPVTY
jgi:hypothetical protein